MPGRPGEVNRRYADIVHHADAEAHRHAADADAQVRRAPGMRRIDPRPHHDDANEERDQRRQHQIVDRAGEVGRQHRHEMHRPDAGCDRQCRSGQNETPAEPLGPVQFAGKREPDETALDRDGDGKNHEPRLVWNGHSAPPERACPPGKTIQARSGPQRHSVVFTWRYPAGAFSQLRLFLVPGQELRNIRRRWSLCLRWRWSLCLR